MGRINESVIKSKIKNKTTDPLTSRELLGRAGVQRARQQSVDVADGKGVQRVVEVRGEAEALQARLHRPVPWVHLDHFTVAWVSSIRKRWSFIFYFKKRWTALKRQRCTKVTISNIIGRFKNGYQQKLFF